MIFYNIGSIIKILAGSGILFFLYQYVNPFQDPLIGLGFGFLGIFLISWGASFYIFYVIGKIFSEGSNLNIASKSYRMSLLLGLFILINIGLIVMERWTKLIGIILLVIFVLLQMLVVSNDEQTEK